MAATWCGAVRHGHRPQRQPEPPPEPTPDEDPPSGQEED